MSFTTPPTFNSGDPLAASDLNILGDDIVYLKGISDGLSFSGAMGRRSTNLSIPDSTYTDVTLPTEIFDYGSWFPGSGATMTVPAGAIPSGYTTIALQVIALVRFVANGTGSRQLSIYQNGSQVDNFGISAISGDATSVSFTSFLVAAAADTIKMQAYQSSGGALNLDVARLTVVRFLPVA